MNRSQLDQLMAETREAWQNMTPVKQEHLVTAINEQLGGTKNQTITMIGVLAKIAISNIIFDIEEIKEMNT